MHLYSSFYTVWRCDRSHTTRDWCSYSLLVEVTVAVAAAEVEADVRGLHLEEARAADHHGRHDGGDDVDQGPCHRHHHYHFNEHYYEVDQRSANYPLYPSPATHHRLVTLCTDLLRLEAGSNLLNRKSLLIKRLRRLALNNDIMRIMGLGNKDTINLHLTEISKLREPAGSSWRTVQGLFIDSS